MTVCVRTDACGYITHAPAIVRKFVGEHLSVLIVWMKRQGELLIENLEVERG